MSPLIYYLTPPEKLVLEVKASGIYKYIRWALEWRRAPGETSHYDEVYVEEKTNNNSLGVYKPTVIPMEGLKGPPPLLILVVQRPGLRL
jgi:hypothetical protein